MTRLLGSGQSPVAGFIGPATYRLNQPRQLVPETYLEVEVLDAAGRLFNVLPPGHCAVASNAYAIAGWSMRMSRRTRWVTR